MAPNTFNLPSPSLTEWARRFKDSYFPGLAVFPRVPLREAMLRDLPQRFHPTYAELLRVWWRLRFRDVARGLGWAFIGGSEGDTMAVQLELPFAEFQQLMVGKLRLSLGADVAAVRRDVREYAAAHPGMQLDVDATVTAFRQAAGY